ncbi:hypothetical protein [Cryobacterium sp. Y11]|uniref:hypothetical protein n=1 Tax=Cryobacterium sp. Y11 TaxID=2045016 RepID=UPI000CE38F7D|nr:hypothetical protein [Cryobacterium sp. Y11]
MNQRSLTLRGDANPVNDPAPYREQDVRIVLFSIPHLAQFVVQLSNPIVLGGATVAASAVVRWAFRPRERESRSPDRFAPATSERPVAETSAAVQPALLSGADR